MPKRPEPKIKLTRRDTLSAIIMTLKISIKAGKGSAIISAAITILDAIINPIKAVLEGALVTALVATIATKDLMPVIWIFLALLGIQLFMSLINRLANLRRNSIWHQISVYTDEMMAIKYASLPLATRESKKGAELFERAQKFQNRITSVSYNVIDILGHVIGFIAAFIALAAISPLLAIVIAAATIPLAIVEFRQMKKSEIDWRKFSYERRKSWRMSEMLTDKDESLEIQVNGLTRFFAREMVRLGQVSARKDIEREKKFFLPRFTTESLGSIVSTGAMIYVAAEIMFGRLAIGQFVTIRSLISTLSTSSAMTFNSVASIGSDLIGANDFTQFLNLHEQPDGSHIIPADTVPRIEFRNVHFHYPDSSVYALRDVSFIFEPGEDIAIVGENGAGKSTIVKLLLGIYEPESGEILINDIPIQQLKRRSYLRHIGTLLQQFNQYKFATLGENVWFGDVRRDYNPDRVKRSLTRAGAKSVYEELPHGIRQTLSREFDEQNGASLSGGQWQKVALARSFFRNPNVLVLDEPTSAIDAKAEYEIFKEIMESQKTKTTIIISHRFSTVRKAQKILVMKKGKIIEQGTHHELMDYNGLYAEMFTLQAEGYK